MRLKTLVLLLVPAALAFSGCAMGTQRTAQGAVARSDGTVSRGVVSAMDALPGDNGPQELVAFNFPFGPFSLKAGLIWNGSTWVIPTPIPAQSFAAPVGACGAPVSACGPQTATVTEMIPETYMETETRTVPKTRMVPRTRQVPVVPVQIPAAPTGPCGQPQSPPPEPMSCVEETPALARG